MKLRDIDNIRYSRGIFSVRDAFLSGDDITDADINYFIQCPVNIRNALREFPTLLVDLKQEQPGIWGDIYHRTRTEINAFVSQEEHESLYHHKMTAKELKYFIQLYNAFAKHKGLRMAEDFRLKAYNKAGLLVVSELRVDKLPVNINFYRVTAARASNLHSFSMKHAGGPHSQAFFGKAHRAHHWLDMLYFKKAGVPVYDFCGIDESGDPALANIAKFKRQFTSNMVVEYSGVIYNNVVLNILKSRDRKTETT